MPASHARNVALTPQLDAFVDELVESGDYSNASEVVRDGLRMLKRKRQADDLVEIQARIATALDQLDRGEGISGRPAEVLGRIVDKVKRRRGQSRRPLSTLPPPSPASKRSSIIR